MKGAQHAGTVRGLGGTRDRGRRRKLEARKSNGES
jgi:hypothetical protein